MSNGKIDDAQMQLLLQGLPEGPERERWRYTLTTLTVLIPKVASIAQHCRFCLDEADAPKKPTEAPKKPEDDRRVWAMWGVGRLILCGLGIPLAVSAMSTVITLAITGKLGG